LTDGSKSVNWIYSDSIPDHLLLSLTELQNPLRLVQQKDGSELTSLFIDAVQPEVDRERRELLDQLTNLAYIPESDFPVSAILETDKGLIGGVNVEFDLWNFGLCAERNAIHTAIAYGARPTGSIAIFAPKSQLCSPCGMCRQTMGEWPFLERVFLYHGDGSCSEHRMEDLLRLHFQATTLGAE
ncbi:MAG: cytidine deaminase family protein, partial [bacterium]